MDYVYKDHDSVGNKRLYCLEKDIVFFLKNIKEKGWFVFDIGDVKFLTNAKELCNYEWTIYISKTKPDKELNIDNLIILFAN